MPIEYRIDHEKRVVTITGRGRVVLQDLLDCMDVVVAQDAMSYPKLIDARDAVADWSDDDVMVLGAYARAYAFYDPRGPVAAVATDHNTIEYLRRFINLATGDRPIRLFASLEKAREWLDQMK
jgi:hypothetical protein